MRGNILQAVTLACASVMSIGCADKSSDISAAYVSPLMYSNYSCEQLQPEYARVMHEASSIARKQDDVADNDSVAMGVGLVLFWPALFFIESDDHKEEVARMKGTVSALEQTAIQKNCTTLATAISDDRIAMAKAAEEKKKKDAAAAASSSDSPY